MASRLPFKQIVVADGDIALAKLAEAVIQADGGQAFTGDQSMGNNKLTNLGAPATSNDAATKSYVDALFAGRTAFKAPVRALVPRAGLAAYTQSGDGPSATLTADANGAIGAQDGVTLIAADRVLVWTSGGHADDGIYTVTAAGDGSNPFVLTRATDADAEADVPGGAYVFVDEGNTYGDTGFILAAAPDTVDTDPQSWVIFSRVTATEAGAGLTEANGVFAVGDGGKGVQVNANDLEIDASEIIGDGLKVGASSHLLAIDASAIAGTGLEDDGSENLRIAAAAAGNGLTGGGGSALSVAANGDSVAVGGSGVSAAVPVTVDKGKDPSTTSGDDAATGLTITKTPGGDGYVQVLINGIAVRLGDGSKTGCDCYFTGDAGATARAISAIAANDAFKWNGTIAGFELANGSDRVDFLYNHTTPGA